MKIEGIPLDLQIAAAVARKAQSVQEIEGQAALDLINAAGEASPPREAALLPDGRGAIINTKA